MKHETQEQAPTGLDGSSGSFDATKFGRLYQEYVKGKLSYAELERRSGGLPRARGALRSLWHAFGTGVALPLYLLRLGRSRSA